MDIVIEAAVEAAGELLSAGIDAVVGNIPASGTSSVCQGIGVLCSTCAISQGYTMWLLWRKAVLAWKNKSVALPTVQNVERTDRRSGVIRRNHSKVKMATGK